MRIRPTSHVANPVTAVGTQRPAGIPALNSDSEFALSARSLGIFFLGKPYPLMRALKAHFPPDVPLLSQEILRFPAMYFSFTVTSVGNEQSLQSETFTAEKRLVPYGKQKKLKAWALNLERDKTRMAKIMGWGERLDVPLFDASQEFSVTGEGLALHFVGTQKMLRGKVEQRFPKLPIDALRISVYPKSDYRLVVKNESETLVFLLRKRRQGSHIIWAVPLAKKSSFARALSLLERVAISRFDPEKEFLLSGWGLNQYWSGNPNQLRQKVEAHFPPDVPNDSVSIRAYPANQFTLHIERDGQAYDFLPEKRIFYVKTAWALPLSDIKRFQEALHFVDHKVHLPFNPESEFAISNTKLLDHFQDGSAACGYSPYLKMRKLLPSDFPLGHQLQHYPKDEIEVVLQSGEKPEWFLFVKRFTGVRRPIWALPISELDRFARVFDLKMKRVGIPPLQACDVPVTERGLSPHFTGKGRVIADAIQVHLTDQEFAMEDSDG